jgi:hypothetical protein
MPQRYLTILAVDHWAILTWNANQQRVQEYITELRGEWYLYELHYDGTDDISVMAHFLDGPCTGDARRSRVEPISCRP